MSEALPLKLIEGGVLLVALVAFAWWQLRDVQRAQDQSARERAARERQAGDPGAEEQR
jgi:hypothetical protein